MSARVLLIEDDASIARFIGLALEELPGHDPAAPSIALHLVRHVAEAREALALGGWQLVISDLMLPDGSAETLLTEGFALAAGAPPWIIFSAGVHSDRHLSLAARGVARTLRKPVPLAELLDTVAELLRPGAAAAAPAPQLSAPVVVDPVQQHFGGDRELFESFRASCIERFSDDLMQGDGAVATGDTAVLCRVAHALKAVLEMIGQPALAGQARALELATADGTLGAPERAAWGGLADGLVALGARRRG
jgi:CheY-like chemotaxis protein